MKEGGAMPKDDQKVMFALVNIALIILCYVERFYNIVQLIYESTFTAGLKIKLFTLGSILHTLQSK